MAVNVPYNPDDDKRPAIQPRTTRAAKGTPRILTYDAVALAAKARNNARSPRGRERGQRNSGITTTPRAGSAGRVAHTTNAPTDGEGNRSVVDGRFTCRTVYLVHWDSDLRRAFRRYVARHGISNVVVEEINGYPSAVDVAGIDGKRCPVTGEWMEGEALGAFLAQPFVVRWEYRTTARTPMIGSGACAADTLSPGKAREIRQSANGLRRYDLQPAHKSDVMSDAPDRDVSMMASGRIPPADAVASILRPLMSAVTNGKLDDDTAGSVIELVRDGTSAPDDVLAWLESL